MTRPQGLAVAALVLAQVLLVAGFFAVEGGRAAAQDFPAERVNMTAPPLDLWRGAEAASVPARTHLVHFWATWCPPCRLELPGLLAAATAEGLPIVAVTDERWTTVRRFFGGTVPGGIFRDGASDGAHRWGVSELPATFVVQHSRVVRRVRGKRDWESAAARRFLRQAQQEE